MCSIGSDVDIDRIKSKHIPKGKVDIDFDIDGKSKGGIHMPKVGLGGDTKKKTPCAKGDLDFDFDIDNIDVDGKTLKDIDIDFDFDYIDVDGKVLRHRRY